jgi:Putative prokaryotic signal transducing protein
MKKLYTEQNPLVVGHLKNLLESGGIRCTIKNLYLAGAIGELPPIECWPELWILDDQRYAEARRLLERTLAPLRAVADPWMCRKCGIEVEGEFSECWSCGGGRPLYKRA